MSAGGNVASGPRRQLTLRALILGVALVVANAYWINEATWDGRILYAYISLFVNAIFCLFVLALMNVVLRRTAPKHAFHASELMTVYIMVVMVSTLSGNTNVGYLVYGLTNSVWFASPENDWARLFGGLIPDWFITQDRDVIRRFYVGESTFFTWDHVRAWLRPLAVWSVFVGVLYGTMLCLNAILRRQFTDHERLRYPVTELPTQMGAETSRFLGNRIMWMGFGISGGIQIINSLHFYNPVIPEVPVGCYNVSHLFSERPWDGMGTIIVCVSPVVIGLAFFMPLDMAFSSWFFWICGRLVMALRSSAGLTSNFYMNEQSEGAWIGLGIIALWPARRHLARVVHLGLNRRLPADDANEPMPYRWALWGAIAGGCLILAFGVAAGASAWAMLVFFGIYFAVAIALTKVRAGLGPPKHEMFQKDPGNTMFAVLGSDMFSPRSMTVLSFFHWQNRVSSAHPMPNQLEAFHMGRQVGLHRRAVMTAILIAVGVGIPITFLTYLWLSYRLGGTHARHTVLPMMEPFWNLQRRLTFATPVDGSASLAMAFGFGFTMFLTVMKARLLSWPFHPIGFVMATGVWDSMCTYWFPFVCAWAIKVVTLRRGGLQAYRTAVPFFAGLILGGYVVGSIWGLIGFIFDIPTYSFLT